MKWRLEGTMASGMPGVVEWGDAGLVASGDALAEIDRIVHEQTGAWVTETGPVLRADKTDELSAYVLGLNVLSRGAAIFGDPPELPDTSVPDGAVA